MYQCSQPVSQSVGSTGCFGSDNSNTDGFIQAGAICMAAGGRLCTFEEMMNDETQGTGCGHDNRLIWSSDSSLSSGGVNLRCARPACSMDLSRSDAQRLVQTF